MIYDLQGRLVKAYNGGMEPVSLPWVRPSAGTYIINLNSGSSKQAKKVVVQ
jgi:hypothetical protein